MSTSGSTTYKVGGTTTTVLKGSKAEAEAKAAGGIAASPSETLAAHEAQKARTKSQSAADPLTVAENAGLKIPKRIEPGQLDQTVANLQAQTATQLPGAAPQVPGAVAATPQTPNVPQSPGVAPVAPPEAPKPTAIQQGYQAAVASGVPPPTSAGAASAAAQSYLPVKPVANPIDTALQEDEGFQDLMNLRREYLDAQNQQGSLLKEYQKMEKSMGLASLDKEILNAKNIIEGTEDDIRNEVTQAGGFSTDSQVQALALSRNKVLLKNYNNLVEQRQNAQDRLNTMIGLVKEDRATASANLDRMLNFETQVLSYKEKFKQNAIAQYDRTIQAVGYDGLMQATGNDPYNIGLVEKTMGLPAGGLKIAADRATEERKLALQKESLGLDVLRSNLETDKAQRANIYSQIQDRANQGDATSLLLAPNLKQSKTGIPYIDGTNLTGKDAGEAMRAAASQGVPYLGKDQADLQANIDTARQNMSNIAGSLKGLLPEKGGDIATRTRNLFQGSTQIGKNAPALASFNAYRSAAIQALRAMAGAKGLRINQAEIMQSVNQDIPKITDTVDVAQHKLDIVNSLLDSQEQSIFGSQFYKPSSVSPNTVQANTHYEANGKSYVLGADGLYYEK